MAVLLVGCQNDAGDDVVSEGTPLRPSSVTRAGSHNALTSGSIQLYVMAPDAPFSAGYFSYNNTDHLWANSGVQVKENTQYFIYGYMPNIYTGNIEKSDTACRIVISGEWYVKALEKNFNIVPQKTEILQFPTQMPKQYWLSYLRGYFDGDGCITFSDNNIHISITSGSPNFLNFCIEYFYQEGIRIRKNKNNATEKPKIYNNKSIHYFLNNAKKILDLLYKNSTISTRLDRKYNLYVNELVNI